MKISEQELFWKGKQGTQYIKRNLKGYRSFTVGRHLLRHKIFLESAVEIGPNIGHNLDALKKIYPHLKTFGIEINKDAYKILRKKHRAINKSVVGYKTSKKFDLVVVTGVLMHQDPKNLKSIYKLICKLSKKYIYLSEYYNPTPVKLIYRGERERLYKRDFAKELWEVCPKLKILDYGFHWKEDPFYKGTIDNTNWFLFKK